MKVEYNLDLIRSFMVDFHRITGLQSALFDTEYNSIACHPPESSQLCARIHHMNGGRLRCDQSCVKGLREAKNSGEHIFAYRCHAGLIEMSFPIYFESEVAGYIIFGQLLDGSEEDRRDIKERCQDLMDDQASWEKLIDELQVTDIDFIYAAARIMETCIQSSLLENMVKIRKDATWERIDRFITENLHNNIQLADIAHGVYVSISTVGHKAKEITGQSVRELILNRRLARAREHLANTDYKINEIASLVGIENYNYFSRVFRETFGYTPRDYRKFMLSCSGDEYKMSATTQHGGNVTSMPSSVNVKSENGLETASSGASNVFSARGSA